MWKDCGKSWQLLAYSIDWYKRLKRARRAMGVGEEVRRCEANTTKVQYSNNSSITIVICALILDKVPLSETYKRCE